MSEIFCHTVENGVTDRALRLKSYIVGAEIQDLEEYSTDVFAVH